MGFADRKMEDRKMSLGFVSKIRFNGELKESEREL